jgi:hypothetical protein
MYGYIVLARGHLESIIHPGESPHNTTAPFPAVHSSGAGAGMTNHGPSTIKDSTLTLILNFLRVLLAEPIRDLRAMLDAGQPTNDLDLMVHAISQLRDQR